MNVHGVLGSCVGLVRLHAKRQVGQDILLHVHGTWSWIYGQMERYQECIYACFFFNLVYLFLKFGITNFLPGSIINDVYRIRLNNPTTFCRLFDNRHRPKDERLREVYLDESYIHEHYNRCKERLWDADDVEDVGDWAVEEVTLVELLITIAEVDYDWGMWK